MDEHEARAVLQRFGEFADQLAECFGRRVQRDGASRYLAGLVNDSARKSMQAMHGRLSDAGTYQALQHFITDSPWSSAPLWTRLRALIPERRGILAVDDTGFPKQGTQSVGVKRQYSGALGKTGNCQVGVSTALIGPTLVWPTSCELYLPQEWAADAARRDKARVPATVRFREKWRIALAHVRQVQRAGFEIDAVVADADYGTTTAFRTGLERLGLRYAVAVRRLLQAWAPGATASCSLEAMGHAVPEAAWQVVTWGHGTKGPLTARFVARRVRFRHGRGERWVLFERSVADDERKYYVLNLDPTASLQTLVRLARSRWPIEQQYRELKDELGLDHFEGRTYPGWAHHMVLTAAAFIFLQFERRRSPDAPRPTLPAVRAWLREIVAIQYFAGNKELFDMAVSFHRNPPLRR
ncbi:MAG TPA: IS701 family transposase [Vicinamibacterales bacterium]